jgi:hypothetical protein
MKSFNRRFQWLSASLIILFIATAAIKSEPPTFDRPVRLSDGSIELTLRGDVGQNYQIDLSTNLIEWALAVAGPAQNGVLVYRHAPSAQTSLFFRARTAADTLPAVTVTPQANTNFLARGMATLSGETIVLNISNPLRFTLDIPTNSVPDATILTVTYVTNFTSLPFAGPLVGAVRIDPQSATFWRGATLEITFPTNIDRRKIATFSCDTNGSAFRMVPGKVDADRLMIPISRGGIYGAVVATEQELNDAARRSVYPPAAPSLPDKKPDATAHAAEDCAPAKKARAEQIRSQIQRAIDQGSSDISALLGIERQRQLTGVTVEPFALFDEANSFLCQFYQTQVAPHWGEAANNCALAKVLLQFALSIERQRQLLGADDDCTSMSNLPLCAMMENCLEEVGDCCDLGFKGPPKIAEVLTIQRQDALLGLNCISNEEATDVIDRCSTNVWRGTFSARTFGTYFFATNQGNTYWVETAETEITFQGAVIESREFGTAATGFQITLTVQGQLSYNDYSSDARDTSHGRCAEGGSSSYYTLEEMKTVGSANTIYTVNVITQPNGAYFIFAGNTGSAEFGIPIRETIINLTLDHRCDGDYNSNRVTEDDTITVGPGMPMYNGQMQEPTSISGSSTADDPNSERPQLTHQFDWDFYRRTGLP